MGIDATNAKKAAVLKGVMKRPLAQMEWQLSVDFNGVSSQSSMLMVCSVNDS
jgi:hypothetical protein